MNNLAWLLATTHVQALRDPEEAIVLAKSATEGDPEHADYKATLAAAYAAVGRFPLAISTQQEAIELLDKDEDPELKESFRDQLAQFRAGMPASD